MFTPLRAAGITIPNGEKSETIDRELYDQNINLG